MHLSPRELEKLSLHGAGFLAQKRLARGLKLNHPESVALIATQILEMIRDGRTVAELMNIGKQLLGFRQVMPGVASMIYDVQVEGTFPDGSKLVTVHHPICREDGDLGLALYGSFLPVPALTIFGPASGQSTLEPGACQPREGQIELNQGRESIKIKVTNLGDRPIQVGSHYHFIETNASLQFDREKSYGMRLDIPAGTAVRFEPGETKSVSLVEIAGLRIIRGGNNLADGAVNKSNLEATMARVKKEMFGHTTN